MKLADRDGEVVRVRVNRSYEFRGWRYSRGNIISMPGWLAENAELDGFVEPYEEPTAMTQEIGAEK